MTINSELFLKIADAIDANPKRHDQKEWHSPCGTVHCIGGWAELLSGKEETDSSYKKQKLLGITRGDAEILFSSEWRPKEGMSVPDTLRTIANGATIQQASDGYDSNGYDRDGYDRDGYNRDDYDRDDYDSDGFDRYGYNRDGYNRDGVDTYGRHKKDSPLSGGSDE